MKRDGTLVDVDLAAIGRDVEATVVDHLRSVIGQEAWQQGMNPDVPETVLVDNPYQYTDHRRDAPRGSVEAWPAQRS